MTPIYTLPHTPGATNVTEWTTFCHSREAFIVINHQTLRHTGRWSSQPRKRPFRVARYKAGHVGLTVTAESWHATIEAAEKAAAKIAAY